MLDNRLTFRPYEAAPAHVEEEFGLLMSLALDDLLDDQEQIAFDEYLERYPALADDWRQWQELNERLCAVPSVLPPAGFMENFEVRLLQQDRRRRLWLGFGFGAVVMLLSVGVILGTVSLGAFVILRQPDWLTQLVHALAYSSAAAAAGYRSLQVAVESIASSGQMRTFGLLYAVVSTGLIGGWIVFLRRTTRISGASPNQTSAA